MQEKSVDILHFVTHISGSWITNFNWYDKLCYAWKILISTETLFDTPFDNLILLVDFNTF